MIYSAVVLAGGASSRMGRDKALVEVGGQSMLAHVLERLRGLAGDLIIVAKPQPNNEYGVIASRFNARLIADAIPGAAALGGLYSGLLAAEADAVIAVACDMPYLNPDLLRFIRQECQGRDAAAPRGDFWHPLHAVYAKGCLAAMRTAIERGELRLQRLLGSLSVRAISMAEVERFDPGRRSLRNINSPADLDAADGA